MILDHLFVLPRGLDPATSLTDSTREAADVFSAALREAGFAEGSSRDHPGQGTTNRRLFLDGLMIECLLVTDEADLDGPRGAPLALGPRFRDPRASALGLAFRPEPDGTGDAPGFDAVPYRPSYLPDGLHIDVAAGLGPDVPLLFHLPFVRPRAGPPADDEPRAHPNGARSATAWRLDSPHPLPVAARAPLERAGVRCVPDTAREGLHVRLAGVAPGFVELDLRPRFPLRLHA